MKTGARVLFVVPYPEGEAPSQRFRFEQYLNFLADQGYSFHLESFYDLSTWQKLYQKGNILHKVVGILKGFWQRFFLLFRLKRFDFVFVHREASPLGWPWFEFICAKVLKKKLIYDFDDAIWLRDPSQSNSLVAWIKFPQKTAKICRWASMVSVGNEYLRQYALNHNKNVLLNRTTIDTEHHYRPLSSVSPKAQLCIGWTGTHSTLKHLEPLLPVLKDLQKEIPFTFRLICNLKPKWDWPAMEFIRWKKDSEIPDLAGIDIGVMPLEDDAWSRGKCGFKALQYLALGIPALVSPVGVNTHIVKDGYNGYCCRHPEEWLLRLKELAEDPELREQMGKNGRQWVEEHYSVKSNRENFLSLFGDNEYFAV